MAQAFTASEERVAREAAPRVLHRTVLGRLAAVSAALSLVLGAAAFSSRWAGPTA